MRFLSLLPLLIFILSPQKSLIERKIAEDINRLMTAKNILTSLSRSGKTYILTAYSPTVEECDQTPFITADGRRVEFGIVASCKKIPFGTKIYIQGLGIFRVHDRGGAIKNNRLDIFYFSTYYAKRFGVQKRRVIFLE